MRWVRSERSPGASRKSRLGYREHRQKSRIKPRPAKAETKTVTKTKERRRRQKIRMFQGTVRNAKESVALGSKHKKNTRMNESERGVEHPTHVEFVEGPFFEVLLREGRFERALGYFLRGG